MNLRADLRLARKKHESLPCMFEIVSISLGAENEAILVGMVIVNNVCKSAAAEDGPVNKKEREVYREIADHIFLEGMNASEPPVPSWKKYAAYWAVRMFGRWAINSSEKRVV